MGYHTLVVINHDCLHEIERDAEFGKNLSKAIGCRGLNSHPISHFDSHNTRLRDIFHSTDSLLVSIESGMVTPLNIEEQIHLQEALYRFRRKQAKQKSIKG